MDITQQLVHRPVKSMFSDGVRKVVTNSDCAEPLCAPGRKIMGRLGLEACSNSFGIGVVTRLDIRSDNALYWLEKRGLRHRPSLQRPFQAIRCERRQFSHDSRHLSD